MTENQRKQAIQKIPTWTFLNEGGEVLTREFVFENFRQALQATNIVGALAEQANHHPDLLVHDYKFLRVTLRTHSVQQVTEKDFSLASQIEAALVVKP